MVKMVRCEDCVYMYHCERTYLGSCDCGVAWGEEPSALDLKEEKDGGEDAKVE